MDSLVTNIIGYLATICMVFGYLPQAIATIRTRKTDGIAMPTFIMLGLGSIFFVSKASCYKTGPSLSLTLLPQSARLSFSSSNSSTTQKKLTRPDPIYLEIE